jgi:membrane protein DedA with SNARE-associated domain
MELIHEAASAIEPFVMRYGVLAVFVVIYFESLGAPLPGETLLVTASLLAQRGDMDPVRLAAAVLVGAVAGDSTGYLIGRVGGRPLLQRYGHVVALTPERLDRFEAMFRRRGAILVVLARFVVVLRQLNGLVAGSMAMPFPRFLAANVLGAAAWTATWIAGPYLLADIVDFRSMTRWL